ncbi:hypothetical protein B0T10DRAFT_525313 [Thelonectria olida]|uniref:C6 zinc finger domain protein n=1 Tax=Thelonectria olida TaxID=1576542 RepID=A0A9P8WIF4_9HYPO|nr:hypothetical protein B0T10DRAFT_525313 [Thelonectria olida]
MPTANERPKKWTRAKAPRVRTGCKTWYAEPRSDGHVCDGYETVLGRKPKSKKADSPPASQEPKALTIREKDVVLAPVSLPPRLIYDASRLPTEMDLFHHFRTCTVQDLGTALTPNEFWYMHALPLGHAVEPIKYAICALGGAHKRFKCQVLGPDAGAVTIHGLEEMAIQQYNLAIHHIKEFTRTPSNSNMEVILTCCVIFICIETLLGRYSEALRHLQSGCALLTSLRQLSAGNVSADGIQREEARERNNFFDDIAAMLSRLGQDVAIYVGADVIPQLYFYLAPELEVQDPAKPFESVTAAAKTLFHIETEWSARIYIAQQQVDGNLVADKIPIDPSLYPEGLENEKIYLDSVSPFYHNWCQRFNLFRSQVDMKALPKQDQHRIMTLSMEQAVWAALLELRSFEEDLRPESADEILRRAEALVRSDFFESMPVFAFDANLVPAMTLRCASVLRSVRRREGIWDSQEMADILESMVIAREKNLVPWDVIPWKVPQLAALVSSLRISPFKPAPKGIISLAEEGVECFWHGVRGIAY